MNRFEEIFQILSSDSKDDKIKVLESLSQTNNPEIISAVWLFEATILFYFFSKAEENKIFTIGIILFII